MENKQVEQSLQITNSAYLTTCVPNALRERCKNIATPLQCLENGECNLATLSSRHGLKKVQALIKAQCVCLNELLNMKHPLTELIIDRVAETVTTEFVNLTMPDVYLVFERGASGYYSKDGELYMVNYSIVVSWFRKYWDERLQAAEERSIRQASALKNGTTYNRSTGCIDLKTFLKKNRS